MHNYESLIKEYFSPYLRPWRVQEKLTQEKMAEKLRISSRAYSYLELSKNGLSAASLLLFLGLLSDQEILQMVRGFHEAVKKKEEQETLTKQKGKH